MKCFTIVEGCYKIDLKIKMFKPVFVLISI